MSTVYVVGLGPGAEEQMTVRAQKVLELSLIHISEPHET